MVRIQWYSNKVALSDRCSAGHLFERRRITPEHRCSFRQVSGKCIDALSKQVGIRRFNVMFGWSKACLTGVIFNFREVVEAYFLSCIKEADVLKHRGQVVSSMQKKDHNQLWSGLLNDKFDQFWSVNRKLMEASNTEEGFKYIPFRCYTSEDKYIQRLVKPVNEEGQRKTLRHLLSEVFPDSENGKYSFYGYQFCIMSGIRVRCL